MIVIDACLTITFGNVQALDMLTGLRRCRLTIAQRAAAEVTRDPAANQLSGALAAESISIATIDLDASKEQEALARFDATPQFRGRGDAEVLALAVSRRWIVGSDDAAVRRAAIGELGETRVAGTLDFLRWAVVEGRCTTSEAVTLLGRLDVGDGLLGRIAAAGTTPEAILTGR